VKQDERCAAVLAGHARCPITVTFTPSAVGLSRGVLTIAATGTRNTIIPLAGTGYVTLLTKIKSLDPNVGVPSDLQITYGESIVSADGPLPKISEPGPVRLTTQPAPDSTLAGWTFARWSGGSPDKGLEPTCTLTPTADVVVVAWWSPLPRPG
jgi:hypothetical protein